jgi:hypothetical protein
MQANNAIVWGQDVKCGCAVVWGEGTEPWADFVWCCCRVTDQTMLHCIHMTTLAPPSCLQPDSAAHNRLDPGVTVE